MRGATKRRPARPEKVAQERRKRFRKPPAYKRVNGVVRKAMFAENSRPESSERSRIGQKKEASLLLLTAKEVTFVI